MKFRSPLLVVAAAALSALAARADDEPRTLLELSGGGAPLDRGVEGARYDVTLGLSLRLRAGPLELGPAVTVSQGRGGQVVSDSVRLGGAAAWIVPIGDWRLSLLGEAGAHWIGDVHEASYESSGVSLGGWSIAQRARVSLPYAGARAGIAWSRRYERSWDALWSRGSRVGLSLFARRDLASGTAVVDYSQATWFGTPSARTVAYDVGGWSAGVLADLAVGW